MKLKQVDLGQDNHWLHLKIMRPDTTVTQFLVREAAMKENGDCEVKLLKNGLTSRPVWVTIPEEQIAAFSKDYIAFGDNENLAAASANSITDALDWRIHGQTEAEREEIINDHPLIEPDDNADPEPQMTPG